jgi:hypothetical protein
MDNHHAPGHNAMIQAALNLTSRSHLSIATNDKMQRRNVQSCPNTENNENLPPIFPNHDPAPNTLHYIQSPSPEPLAPAEPVPVTHTFPYAGLPLHYVSIKTEDNFTYTLSDDRPKF